MNSRILNTPAYKRRTASIPGDRLFNTQHADENALEQRLRQVPNATLIQLVYSHDKPLPQLFCLNEINRRTYEDGFNESFYSEGGVSALVDIMTYLDRPESNILDKELKQCITASSLRCIAHLSVFEDTAVDIMTAGGLFFVMSLLNKNIEGLESRDPMDLMLWEAGALALANLAFVDECREDLINQDAVSMLLTSLDSIGDNFNEERDMILQVLFRVISALTNLSKDSSTHSEFLSKIPQLLRYCMNLRETQAQTVTLQLFTKIISSTNVRSRFIQNEGPQKMSKLIDLSPRASPAIPLAIRVLQKVSRDESGVLCLIQNNLAQQALMLVQCADDHNSGTVFEAVQLLSGISDEAEYRSALSELSATRILLSLLRVATEPQLIEMITHILANTLSGDPTEVLNFCKLGGDGVFINYSNSYTSQAQKGKFDNTSLAIVRNIIVAFGPLIAHESRLITHLPDLMTKSSPDIVQKMTSPIMVDGVLQLIVRLVSSKKYDVTVPLLLHLLSVPMETVVESAILGLTDILTVENSGAANLIQKSTKFQVLQSMSGHPNAAISTATSNLLDGLSSGVVAPPPINEFQKQMVVLLESILDQSNSDAIMSACRGIATQAPIHIESLRTMGVREEDYGRISGMVKDLLIAVRAVLISRQKGEDDAEPLRQMVSKLRDIKTIDDSVIATSSQEPSKRNSKREENPQKFNRQHRHSVAVLPRATSARKLEVLRPKSPESDPGKINPLDLHRTLQRFAVILMSPSAIVPALSPVWSDTTAAVLREIEAISTSTYISIIEESLADSIIDSTRTTRDQMSVTALSFRNYIMTKDMNTMLGSLVDLNKSILSMETMFRTAVEEINPRAFQNQNPTNGVQSSATIPQPPPSPVNQTVSSPDIKIPPVPPPKPRALSRTGTNQITRANPHLTRGHTTNDLKSAVPAKTEGAKDIWVKCFWGSATKMLRIPNDSFQSIDSLMDKIYDKYPPGVLKEKERMKITYLDRQGNSVQLLNAEDCAFVLQGHRISPMTPLQFILTVSINSPLLPKKNVVESKPDAQKMVPLEDLKRAFEDRGLGQRKDSPTTIRINQLRDSMNQGTREQEGQNVNRPKRNTRGPVRKHEENPLLAGGTGTGKHFTISEEEGKYNNVDWLK
ncbi:hypothetical protein PROFUN_02893 [Planoprotostelium fungivorum]|uniref:Uncharacterized protein n=1 Tax=Planoprotostelium fungivorum TaxID=1890364 RepID=A0A2P6NS02_9EUKA|nr:hypothetical protein PROFUN_02893 [Planoprotostelium fungivorum]